MNSIADGSVILQTSSESVPSVPPWFGEVALIVQHLRRQGILSAICERVRFARSRFGHYDVIDFVAVLFGYAISGERTLEAFYERLHPFASAFMALFGRERLPSRSTLSRFLASLTQPPVEALRTLFLEDLLARPLNKEKQTGGLVDRAGKERIVFDVDGTREAARQRALPKKPELPAPQRRLDEVCAPGYTGRKRGEIVRTRTTISQAHTSQWFGSFANPGNGLYREELRRAVAAIGLYSKVYGLPEELILLRLDGLHGTGAVIADLAGFSYVTRGKDYTVLDRAEVQIRLHLLADQQFTRPESDLVRALYDCPDVLLEPTGQRSRVVVVTHPTHARKSRIGLTRAGVITNSSSPTCPRALSPLPMSSPSTCIGALLNPSLPMKTRNKSPTAGVVTRLPGRRRGRSSINGCGTCGWNWDISFIPIPCAAPHCSRLSACARGDG